jgi:hypothetical protein
VWRRQTRHRVVALSGHAFLASRLLVSVVCD